MVPPPTWVTSGMPSSSHTDHSGSQTRPVVLGQFTVAHRREVHAAQPGLVRPLDLGDRGVDVPHREVGEPDVSVRCLRRRSRRASGCRSTCPTPASSRLAVVLALPSAGGDERDRLQVHRAVEDDAGRDAVVVVVGESSGRVVVTGGAEVRVVEVAAALEHRCRSGLAPSPSTRRTGRTRRGASTGSTARRSSTSRGPMWVSLETTTTGSCGRTRWMRRL